MTVVHSSHVMGGTYGNACERCGCGNQTLTAEQPCEPSAEGAAFAWTESDFHASRYVAADDVAFAAPFAFLVYCDRDGHYALCEGGVYAASPRGEYADNTLAKAELDAAEHNTRIGHGGYGGYLVIPGGCGAAMDLDSTVLSSLEAWQLAALRRDFPHVADSADQETGLRLIRNAEAELGRLSAGQCRDLLCDNTDWNADRVARIVERIKPAAKLAPCLVARNSVGKIMEVIQLPRVVPGRCARSSFRYWYGVARDRNAGCRIAVERGVRDSILREPCQPATRVILWDHKAAPRSAVDIMEFDCSPCEAMQIVRRYRMDCGHPVSVQAGYADASGTAFYPLGRHAEPHRLWYRGGKP